MIFKFAAEHHSSAGRVDRLRFDGVVVQAPNYVAHGALVVHAHGEMNVRRYAEIQFPEMIGGLVPSAQFAAGGAQDEILIETKGQPVGVRVVEGYRAGVHCLFHICNERRLRGAWLRGADARHTAFQVDGYPQLLQEVHAENSVEWAAARFGDCGQVNRREPDASETMAAQRKLADRNFAGV
jgi:hypothetical protein